MESGRITNMQFVDKRFNYLGMYNWTNDLPSNCNSKQIFEDILEYFNTKKINKPRILEIGTYVGVSLIKIMEKIPESMGTVIDMWSDYTEFCNNSQVEMLSNMKSNNTENVFYNNIKIAGLSDRVKTIKGKSSEVLFDFLKNDTMFDLIYVDGSHTLLDSYIDIMLSWKILNKGGILIIDDVPYNKESVLDSPYYGVLKFLNEYRDEMNNLSLNYRVFVEKKGKINTV